MADIKISGLATSATSIGAIAPIVIGGVTKQLSITGIDDANAIATAIGASLYARLFGILDAGWGNGGQPPAPKGTVTSVSCPAPGPTTVATLTAGDQTYVVTSRINAVQAANCVWAIINVSSYGDASIIFQNYLEGHILSISGLNIQIQNGSGVTQTFHTTITPTAW